MNNSVQFMQRERQIQPYASENTVRGVVSPQHTVVAGKIEQQYPLCQAGLGQCIANTRLNVETQLFSIIAPQQPGDPVGVAGLAKTQASLRE